MPLNLTLTLKSVLALHSFKFLAAGLCGDLVERHVRGQDLNPVLRSVGIVPVLELPAQAGLRAARPRGRQQRGLGLLLLLILAQLPHPDDHRGSVSDEALIGIHVLHDQLPLL